MPDDPFAALCRTSDNDAYVALARWDATARGSETSQDELDLLDDASARGAGSATARALGRGAPFSGAAQPDRPLASPRSESDEGASRVRERVNDEPVRAILPSSIVRDREREIEAAAARESGAVVPLEPGDDAATVALKGRLARLHLAASEEGMHARALETLDEIASGEAEAIHVTKNGDLVRVPLHPRFRSAAAKAILSNAAAAARTSGGKVEVGNAQILAAGDVIAQVDPDKLRAAVARLRAAQASE